MRKREKESTTHKNWHTGKLSNLQIAHIWHGNSRTIKRQNENFVFKNFGKFENL